LLRDRLLAKHPETFWTQADIMIDVIQHFDLKSAPTPQRSRIMSAIRSKGNKSTEERLIKIMKWHNITGWRRGWQLPGKPDFVFPKYRLAVFVDGCFWHGCPRCYKEPKENTEYWREKIKRNVLRDRRIMLLLRKNGWRAMRFWEHSLKSDNVVANRIKKAICL
jgi:DNA mismatch endonuclease (patch repair protein)